jgi:hypothetical protein
MVQIARFSIHQTAKVIAVLYFGVTALFVPFFIFVGFGDAGAIKWLFLLAPMLYGIFGYIFAVLACWAYNVLAKRIGGIEFSLREVASEDRDAIL